MCDNCGKRKSQSSRESRTRPSTCFNRIQVTMENFLLKSQFDSLETQHELSSATQREEERERERTNIYFVKELKLLSSK